MSSAIDPSDASRETGRLVRHYREAAGLSQRELADRLGCQQPAIARLEAGGVSPNMRTLERIAEALGGVIDWHVTGRDTALAGGVAGVMRQYVAADQSVTEKDGVVRLQVMVDAEPPADSNWHVDYLAPVKVEPGQPMSVQIQWRGAGQAS
jgi:transcriptional regulator with XRE-family HTH domain